MISVIFKGYFAWLFCFVLMFWFLALVLFCFVCCFSYMVRIGWDRERWKKCGFFIGPNGLKIQFFAAFFATCFLG